MKSVSLKISKVHKVTHNLQQKEQLQHDLKQQIKESLNARMELHFQKRENYQEGKLNSFKQMELRWKDKLKAIGQQAKERNNQNLLRSNKLTK